MRNLEATILAKAAALGLAAPTFRMIDAPDLFAGWADRVAEAGSLRASGKPYLAALDEADRHLGCPATRLAAPPLAIRPLSDWLGEIARLLGSDAEPVPRPSKAAVAAPLT